MKRHRLVTALALVCVCLGKAHACVCEADIDKAEVSKWIGDRTAAASYVVLARIAEVKTSGKVPALDTIVKIETLEELKGAPRFDALTISECQNFELRENDTRVLFLTADGMICGCSEYRQFVSDAQILKQLREGVRKNAN